MITHAVILAAGRGRRLHPITATRSKALAPVAGKPIIVRVLDSLWQAGVNRVVVVVAPHDHGLKDLCARLPRVVVRVQREPLGSADALRSCADLLHEPFYLSSCDSLVSPEHIRDLGAVFEQGDATAVLSVLEVSSDVSLESRSVVRLEGRRVIDIIEKPRPEQRLSNTTALPLYALSPQICAELSTLQPSPRGEYELPAAFRQMIARGERVLACSAPWRHDLTDVNDLLHLNKLFLQTASPQLQIHESVVVPASVRITPPVIIDEGCVLGEGVNLGPLVYLEHGARIESQVSVRESVVTRGAVVKSDVQNSVCVG